MVECGFCGCPRPIDGICDVYGWDGIVPLEEFLKTPFDDKENFDQAFYDSIELPKKPPSAKKWLIILSALDALFLFVSIPFAILMGAVIAFVYLGMKGDEETWEHIMENPEWYKKMVYNMSKL